MGFYNVQAGDMPYFTKLAREYAMSDNFHQAVEGGTGANHIALGFGTRSTTRTAPATPATPPANQIENPDPQPGTNNWYTQDGYGGGSLQRLRRPVAARHRGGSRLSATRCPTGRSAVIARRAHTTSSTTTTPATSATAASLPSGDTIFTIPPTTRTTSA